MVLGHNLNTFVLLGDNDYELLFQLAHIYQTMGLGTQNGAAI